MIDLERLSGTLDEIALQYVRRYKSVACAGNEVLAGYLEGRAAGLTQAAVLLRGEALKHAKTDEEVSG